MVMMKRPKRNKDSKERKNKRMPKKRAMRVDMAEINYKNLRFLQQFVTDRGKLLPRRMTNVSAKSQRAIAVAVRQARILAFLPVASLPAHQAYATPMTREPGEHRRHSEGKSYASDSAR